MRYPLGTTALLRCPTQLRAAPKQPHAHMPLRALHDTQGDNQEEEEDGDGGLKHLPSGPFDRSITGMSLEHRPATAPPS
jgi:hypothetical protein